MKKIIAAALIAAACVELIKLIKTLLFKAYYKHKSKKNESDNTDEKGRKQ